MTTAAPYGSWVSPIAPASLTHGAVGLGGLTADGEDLYWLEGRPTEGGRTVIVQRRPDNSITDITPPGFNSRTRIHEYGGGGYGVAGGMVLSCAFDDQRIWRLDLPVRTAITQEPQIEAGDRYGDFCFAGDRLICVRERHREQGEPVNEIVSLPLDGSDSPRVEVSGHDFYSTPCLSPNGRQLAWLAWNHPNMPWDGTELYVADIESGVVGEPVLVAGGPDESIFQPEWSPGGALHFVSDRSGWWNIYRRSVSGDVPLAPMEAEFGHPQWVFGMRRYRFLPDGRIAAIYQVDGLFKLGIIGVDGMRDIPLDRDDLAPVIAVASGKVWLVAGGPALADAVIGVDPETGEYVVVREAMSVELDSGYVSRPEPISFPTTGGAVAHAFYYPPTNPDFLPLDGELPPLVVFSHGGPTSATTSGLRLSIQYWTSRGFALVDVNYRGSTGYGRAYREALKGKWGIVDTEDCIAAAEYLASRGVVDRDRMAIRGGSAGGYTTLCALTFHDVFATGASYYGVADCESLATDTHKFESRYLDGLIGPYPEAVDVYRQRSPVRHTDRLSRPMIILQGLDDRVVPPDQAEQMVSALDEKGIAYTYLAFEGEGHGFRGADTIERAAEAELSFYAWVFGFVPAGDIRPAEIRNA